MRRKPKAGVTNRSIEKSERDVEHRAPIDQSAIVEIPPHSSAGGAPSAVKDSASWWRRVPEPIRDIVWPVVLPSTVAEEKAERERIELRRDADLAAVDALASGVSDEAIADAADAIKASLEAEKDRRASVEARLTTVLGMVSVAASVAFGALTSVFGKGFQGVNARSAVLGAVLMVYAVVQLVNALLASLRGLRRAAYETIAPADVLPRSGESPTEHRLRIMKVGILTRVQHADVNSRKVEAMAVAHVALRNFVIAVLALSILVAAVMAWPGEDTSVEQQIVRRIRSDSALIELLRGPRGNPGPQGSPGIKGERGPAGPAGPPASGVLPDGTKPRSGRRVP
jgi:hypothetical protein